MFHTVKRLALVMQQDAFINRPHFSPVAHLLNILNEKNRILPDVQRPIERLSYPIKVYYITYGLLYYILLYYIRMTRCAISVEKLRQGHP